MATIIRGEPLVTAMVPRLVELTACLGKHGIVPRLDLVLVGDNPASLVFIERKRQFAQKIGVNIKLHRLSPQAKQVDVKNLLLALGKNPSVHGVVLQLPLPAHLHVASLVKFIAPAQDVDGLHPLSMGNVIYNAGEDYFTPCTPQIAIMLLKDYYRAPLVGKAALVVGHSTLVGRPLAEMLLHENCTVTVAHRFTRNLAELVGQAEIVVSATGVPGLIRGSWLAPTAVVIDIGTSLCGGKVTGDVNFSEAEPKVKAISPVPGGVGPLTVAVLIMNVLRAAARRLPADVSLPESAERFFQSPIASEYRNTN